MIFHFSTLNLLETFQKEKPLMEKEVKYQSKRFVIRVKCRGEHVHGHD